MVEWIKSLSLPSDQLLSSFAPSLISDKIMKREPPNLAASIELIRNGWPAASRYFIIISKIDYYKCHEIKINASVELKIELMSNGQSGLVTTISECPVIKRPITHQSTKGAKRSYCKCKKIYIKNDPISIVTRHPYPISIPLDVGFLRKW